VSEKSLPASIQRVVDGCDRTKYATPPFEAVVWLVAKPSFGWLSLSLPSGGLLIGETGMETA
jgi:hypothetical protein